jgi:hypothetical protein
LEVFVLERGPLSLANTTDELLERKSSGSGLESREYGRKKSITPTTRHCSIRKSWQWLLRQSAVSRSALFARGFRSRSWFVRLFVCLLGDQCKW